MVLQKLIPSSVKTICALIIFLQPLSVAKAQDLNYGDSKFLQLPFSIGETWRVSGGFSNTTNQNGKNRTTRSKHYYLDGGAIDFSPEGKSSNKAVAVAHGFVTDIVKNTASGDCFIELTHPDNSGIKSYYQHLESFDVKKGDEVWPNTRLGTLAQPKDSCYPPEGSHLHFFIRPQSAVLDKVNNQIVKWKYVLSDYEVSYDYQADKTCFKKNGNAKCGAGTFSVTSTNISVANNEQIPSPKNSSVYQSSPTTISSKFSQKCLMPRGYVLKGDIEIIQDNCIANLSQAWRFSKQSSGFYAIESSQGNLCFDIRGGYKENGGEVILWPCHYAANQLWKVAELGNGYVEIRSLISDLCMDVNNENDNAIKSGANIIQYQCHSGDNQQWRIYNTFSFAPLPQIFSNKSLLSSLPPPVNSSSKSLGRILNSNSDVKILESQASQIQFENGLMLWIGSFGKIIVLQNNGSWVMFSDDFDLNEKESTSHFTPPPGKFVPERSFGKIWKTNENVRTNIGWMNKPETGFTATLTLLESGNIIISGSSQNYFLMQDGHWY